MFDHDWIDTYAFEDVPVERDIFLMQEKWLGEYEAAILGFLRNERSDFNIGEIAYAATRSINAETISLSWYPNIFDRFHQVQVFLPRSAFITCVSSWQIDEKPHVFVTDQWLDDLYRRRYAVFAMVDAIDVKLAILRAELTTAKLLVLQQNIDEIAIRYPDVAFVSFADNLLIKTIWSPGDDPGAGLAYESEHIILILSEIDSVYRSALGLGTYAVIAQGNNEYDALLHISETRNHISLNSLGLPFAQILAMDVAARAAIKNGDHPPAEIYMDDDFFHSLRLAHEVDKAAFRRGTYAAPMATGPGPYVMADRDELVGAFRAKE